MFKYKNKEIAEKRYEELYDKAVRRYLDKTDWDIYEWLDTEKEKKEFEYLANNL